MSLDALLARAARRPARILLAGGAPELLNAAAERLHRAGLTDVGVVGVGAMHPEGHRKLTAVAELLRAREPNRVRDAIDALDLAADPIRFGTGLAALGEVDALVTGPGVMPQTLAAAHRWTSDAATGRRASRSASWLLLPDGSLVGFADCAFGDEDAPAALAELAAAVAAIHQTVADGPAGVVFPSDRVDVLDSGRASLAVQALRSLDARIQAEASGNPRFRGTGNVFIFPDRTSAHLASRAVRALAGALLLGPLLIGGPGIVAGVAEDAGVDELVGTAAVAALASGNARI